MARNYASMIIALLVGAGCGGGDGGAEKKKKEQPDLDCSNLALERAEGLPLDEIGVTGIPGGLGEQLAAQVTADGAATITIIFRDQGDDENETVLIAPIHPQGLVNGGAVELAVRDDEGNSCPPIPFQILPLPPSPGAVEESLGLLSELLETQLTFFGISLEELRSADPTTLPVELLPLFVAQNSLNDPENPDSFVAIVAGTAPALEGMEPDRELLDALFGHLGVSTLIESTLGSWDDLMEKRPDAPEQRRSMALTQGPSAEMSAAELDYQMGIAAWGDFYGPDTPSGQYLRDLSLGVGLVGLIPAPPLQIGAAVTGGALFAFLKTTEASASLYPSKFVSMEFEVTPESWLEDSPESGEWFKVEVVAASKGWNLDQTILESILQVAGMGSAYSGWLKSFDPDGFVAGVTDFLRTEAVNQVIGAAAGGSGIIRIPAEETWPVDVTEEPWTKVKYHFAFQEDGTRQGFRLNPDWPESAGSIVISTAREHFGNAWISKRAEPEIAPVRIVIQPDAVTVDPGEEVTFEVEVQNAHDPTIEVSTLSGTFTVSDQGEGKYLVHYTAPADEEGLPDGLTIQSLTTSGMFANPERVGPLAQAMIRGTAILVDLESPERACIPGGEKETFVATVVNAENQAISWSVSGGVISGTGVFTAPKSGGTVIVTATSVADPTVFASITVLTGKCDCVFSSNLFGSAGQLAGSEMIIGEEDGLVGSLLFASDLSDLDMGDWIIYRKQLTLWAQQGPAVGSTGSFAAEARSSYVGWEDEFSTHEEETLQVTISRFDEASDGTAIVEGRVSGTVYWFKRGGRRSDDVFDEYQSKKWPDLLQLEFSGKFENVFGVYTCTSGS